MQVLLQAVSYFYIGHELSVLYVRILIVSKSCYQVYSHTLICREYPMENRMIRKPDTSKEVSNECSLTFWEIGQYFSWQSMVQWRPAKLFVFEK